MNYNLKGIYNARKLTMMSLDAIRGKHKNEDR
jgi:hypothetical protein